MNDGGIVWLTGLPAAGKTTLAGALAQRLKGRGAKVEIVDGDQARLGFSKGLGFGKEDRIENCSRMGHLARTVARQGGWAIVAAVSPYHEIQDGERKKAQEDGLDFVLVHVRCPVQIARSRDTKGHYRKAETGEIQEFSGVSAPYEAPERPDVVYDSDAAGPEEGARRIGLYLALRPDRARPFILAGRGYGGTRLLSKIVQDFGIFLGNDLNETGDSIEWIDIVYRMVYETAGRSAFQLDDRYRSRLHDTARKILEVSGLPYGIPWGFKLPETMLVLPEVLDAFPMARVIHLVRHPIASSLRRPHLTARFEEPLGRNALPGAYLYAGRDLDKIESDPPHRRSAVSWLHQVERVALLGRELGPGRYLELRYEDLCHDPDFATRKIAHFAGIAGRKVHSTVAIDRTRMNAWDEDDPAAREVWEMTERAARLFGYLPKNPL